MNSHIEYNIGNREVMDSQVLRHFDRMNSVNSLPSWEKASPRNKPTSSSERLMRMEVVRLRLGTAAALINTLRSGRVISAISQDRRTVYTVQTGTVCFGAICVHVFLWQHVSTRECRIGIMRKENCQQHQRPTQDFEELCYLEVVMSGAT